MEEKASETEKTKAAQKYKATYPSEVKMIKSCLQKSSY